MLLVFLPVTAVFGAIQMAIGAKAVSLVIFPAAVVHITIGMDEPTIAVSFAISPVSLVHRAVWPYLDTLTLTNVSPSDPLTLILGLIFQQLHWSWLTVA